MAIGHEAEPSRCLRFVAWFPFTPSNVFEGFDHLDSG
jgi:hypothetical protein